MEVRGNKLAFKSRGCHEELNESGLEFLSPDLGLTLRLGSTTHCEAEPGVDKGAQPFIDSVYC